MGREMGSPALTAFLLLFLLILLLRTHLEEREGVEVVERQPHVAVVERAPRLLQIDVAILAEGGSKAERVVFLEGVARRQVHAHGEALGVVAHLVVVERHRGRRAEVLLLEEGASRGDRATSEEYSELKPLVFWWLSEKVKLVSQGFTLRL